MHSTVSGRAAVVACAIGAFAVPALASVPSYTLVGSYAAPTGAWDVLSDGRLVSIDSSGVIRAQSQVNGASFSQVGSIDGALINSFGASFLSVSGDGSTLAIGDGNFGVGASVYTVDVASLSTSGDSLATGFAVGNFAGAWLDGSTLAISGSDNASGASVVTRLDTLTGDTRVLVNDLAGASGGVATDGQYLYTGNGFSFGGGSGTGEVRAFDLADLTGPAVSFESDGITVADVLSASSLDFDAEGNLLAGGGDAFSGSGDFGYAGVVDSDAIQDALNGLGYTPGATLELTPDPLAEFVGVRFNDVTGEVLVQTGGLIYRYQVPAPGVGAILALGAPMIARRRRNV